MTANTFWHGKLNSDPDAFREFSLPNITNDALAALECCLLADVGLSDGTHFALEVLMAAMVALGVLWGAPSQK